MKKAVKPKNSALGIVQSLAKRGCMDKEINMGSSCANLEKVFGFPQCLGCRARRLLRQKGR